MLNTNLLPPEEQKIISREKWLHVIRFLGIASSGVLIIGITLLAPSYLPLYFENRELLRSLAIQQEVTKKIGAERALQDASRVQSLITLLRKSIDRPMNALILFDLFTSPKRGIAVTSFAIDDKGAVSISGTAITRNDLLLFEQYLRESNHLQNIASPLANIIQEANINFNFKGTLKEGHTL